MNSEKITVVSRDFIDSNEVIGRVVIEARDRSGAVVIRQETKNLVVDSGKNLIRDMIAGVGLRPDTIEVGTGTTSPVVGDTELETSVWSQLIDRRIRTNKIITFEIVIGFSDANGNSLAEEGIFQGATMLARSLISPAISKTASIEVTISHEIEMV